MDNQGADPGGGARAGKMTAGSDGIGKMKHAGLRAFALNARTALITEITQKYKILCTKAAAGSYAPAQSGQLKELKELHERLGEAEFAGRMAYFWFNCLCALRFLDVKGYYQGFMTVSPRGDAAVPEILACAEQGLFDAEVTPPSVQQRILRLSARPRRRSEESVEIYRLLLLSVCAFWHERMPFMFRSPDECCSLLLPDSLLTSNSLLHSLQQTLDAEACRDVEVLGWLYQYYIAGRKAEIYTGLKQHDLKVSAAELPAATQIFTPHWIVRFLAENSTGRLWLLNHPASTLAASMPFWQSPLLDQAELPFIELSSPKELRVCDPCCGSGHMLTYTFELLSKIYAEEGYLPEESAALILEHNLCGLEIDERAAELAAFALCMKARALDRGFFMRHLCPRIVVLKNISFSRDEILLLKQLLQQQTQPPQEQPVQQQLTPALEEELRNVFACAQLVGSLVRISPELKKLLPELKKLLPKPGQRGRQQVPPQSVLAAFAAKLEDFILCAELLSASWDVVITNPPYLGRRNLAPELACWLKTHYPEGKQDLCTAFILKISQMLRPHAYSAMLTMQSWMFLSGGAALRKKLFSDNTVVLLAHLGAGAFDSVGGDVVQTAAHIFQKGAHPGVRGVYIRLTEENGERGKEQLLLSHRARVVRCAPESFRSIPGAPLAYWLSERAFELFASRPPIALRCHAVQGLATADNERFLRYWHEVSFRRINFMAPDAAGAAASGCRWFPYNKGGENRRWYGNQEYVVNWEDDGREIRNQRDQHGKQRSRPQNTEYYFKEAVSWTLISSEVNAFRYFPPGFIFDIAGMSLFAPGREQLYAQLGFLNSAVAGMLINAVNPTVSLPNGDLGRLPYVETSGAKYQRLVQECVDIAKNDWDDYESSWNFRGNALLRCKRGGKIRDAWEALRSDSEAQTARLQELETENNRIVNSALALEGELASEVSREAITLFCNPAWRYKGSLTEEEQWRRYLADTIKEFISYAAGCIFGRYAPEKPGLILASPGEGLQAYAARIPSPLFKPAKDNLMPLYADEHKGPDLVSRLREFVKAVFGEQDYEENLSFIDEALSFGKAGEYRPVTLRRYLVNDFYPGHVRRCHGRPFYWLFSSSKGSFMVLAYLHRWTPGTISRVLNVYLRPRIAALGQHEDSLKSALAAPVLAPRRRSSLQRELECTLRERAELTDYEPLLLELSEEDPQPDLDEGVMRNYLRLCRVLKKLPRSGNKKKPRRT